MIKNWRKGGTRKSIVGREAEELQSRQYMAKQGTAHVFLLDQAMQMDGVWLHMQDEHHKKMKSGK